MSYHSHPSVGSFVAGIDEMIEKINKKPIPIKIYGFRTDMDTSWVYGDKNIQDGSTNIGQVMEHIKSNQNNRPLMFLLLQLKNLQGWLIFYLKLNH